MYSTSPVTASKFEGTNAGLSPRVSSNFVLALQLTTDQVGNH